MLHVLLEKVVNMQIQMGNSTREIKFISKNEMEMLDIILISRLREMKNALNVLICTLNIIVKERFNKLEDRSIEIIQR